jgi:hypothetical protein
VACLSSTLRGKTLAAQGEHIACLRQRRRVFAAERLPLPAAAERRGNLSDEVFKSLVAVSGPRSRRWGSS